MANITREEVEAVALLLANDQEGTFDLIISTDADQLWMIICGALVFFMHAGFAMLEAGSIHETSVANIMFKNISTVSIGVLAYWVLGFGLAFPEDNDEDTATILARKGDFVGKASDKAFWFFQMVFAATAATIVSGAVAGRIKLTAYFVIAALLTGIVFPFITHWIFDVGGYLSGFTQKDQLFNFAEDNVPCGTIDFAGSGVVHLTGGVAAFWGALILGPRDKWAPDKNELPAHNFALATLGTFILWFGWFGFNCGSTLAWDGFTAGHVAVATVLSPAASCIVGMLIGRFYLKEWNIALALNSILAGLVAITAGAATTRPGFAILVGLLAGFVYFGASRLNRFIFKIDDPVDAVAVHGACGLFGLIMAGIVADDRLVQVIYSQDNVDCNTQVPALLTYQVIAAITIFAWTSLWGIGIFGGLALTGQLKLNTNEQYNVDEAEHGGGAYNLD